MPCRYTTIDMASMEKCQPLCALLFYPCPVALLLRNHCKMIAVQDIGKWAAHMFLHREHYLSRAVEIAGDEVTFSQMVSAYKKVYGKTPSSMWLPSSLFSMGDIGKMFTWITKYGYNADLTMNRAEIPDLLTFEQFLALKQPL